MSAPWFEPNLFSWIPGTLLGTLGGIWGSLLGVLAPQGKARRFVIGTGFALWIVSIALLIAGVVAITQGQPYGVWYGLGLAGLIGTILFSALLPTARNAYAQAEARKLQSKDINLS